MIPLRVQSEDDPWSAMILPRQKEPAENQQLVTSKSTEGS